MAAVEENADRRTEHLSFVTPNGRVFAMTYFAVNNPLDQRKNAESVTGSKAEYSEHLTQPDVSDKTRVASAHNATDGKQKGDPEIDAAVPSMEEDAEKIQNES